MHLFCSGCMRVQVAHVCATFIQDAAVESQLRVIVHKQRHLAQCFVWVLSVQWLDYCVYIVGPLWEHKWCKQAATEYPTIYSRHLTTCGSM